jgi:hypothetical protein
LRRISAPAQNINNDGFWSTKWGNRTKILHPKPGNAEPGRPHFLLIQRPPPGFAKGLSTNLSGIAISCYPVPATGCGQRAAVTARRGQQAFGGVILQDHITTSSRREEQDDPLLTSVLSRAGCALRRRTPMATRPGPPRPSR